jgi:trehalose 2-sulfotransferase
MFTWPSLQLGRFARLGLRGYAICTVPRSGSNLLCQWLTSTGMLGQPLEYFNGSARRILTDPNYPDSRKAQIQWILTKAATPNLIYGLKLFASHNTAVSTELDWTRVLPHLKYVYLERRDRLGQAISWVRAIQTSQYRSTQPIKDETRYDATMIYERLAAIEWEHAHWVDFFMRRRIKPLRIVYEDSVQEPQRTVGLVAAAFNLDSQARVDLSRVDLAIQRDAVNLEWRTRYLAEAGFPSQKA